MTRLMAAELSGDLLRVALYELIPQIEDGKRYLVRIDAVEREKKLTITGNDLSIDMGPMTEEEETEYQPELTYGDHALAVEKRGVSRIDLQAINHAHIEPRDRSDVAGNEVQPIGIKLRESAAHDWMYNDDAEVVPPKMDDGWIEWHGPACPVDKNATVLVKFRQYENKRSVGPKRAGFWDWGQKGGDGDIVEYKIVAPAVACE